MTSPDDSVPTMGRWGATGWFRLIRRIVLGMMLVLFALALLGTRLEQGVLFGPTYSTHITAEQQTRMLGSALDTMRLDLGRYPTTEEGLALLVTEPRDTALAQHWHGPYIEGAVPLDPWRRPFHYSVPGKDPYPFALYSNGPDRSAGMVIGYPPPD